LAICNAAKNAATTAMAPEADFIICRARAAAGREDEPGGRGVSYGQAGGALLLSNTRGGPSTVIEGSSRFVGELPTAPPAALLKSLPTA